MIQKLKIKFVALTMTSLFLLLSLMVTAINMINYQSVVQESDSILSVLTVNKGAFPDPGGPGGDRLPHELSPEIPFESRYFSVFMGKDGTVHRTDVSRIASVDESRAQKYAYQAMETDSDRGFIDHFRYSIQADRIGQRIIFLDCSRSLSSFRVFLIASIAISLVGFALVFVVIFLLSGRILRPIAQSYEKQRQFITDASHELKTPLTIISANVDILEMEQGENESLSDIRQQTRRLRDLTNDLVLLSRMEETERQINRIDIPISEIVQEAAHPYAVMAQQQSKIYSCSVQPMLSLCADEKSIRQLVGLLLDNALKYTPCGGSISLQLSKQGKNILLRINNSVEKQIDKQDLPRLFERFYRTDASRNSQTGGHGIGLSVAKAIVTAHNGKISVTTTDSNLFCISIIFPQ